MNPITLATFATSNWKQSPERYKQQLSAIQHQVNLFSKAYLLNETSLGDEFHAKFDKYANEYGYCLYAWKPFVLENVLKTMSDEEVLLYIDGGSQLPVDNCRNFQKRLEEEIAQIKSKPLMIGAASYYNEGDRENCRVVRKQILESFGLQHDEFFLHRYPHFEAGGLVIIKNDSTVKFVNDWKMYFMNRFEDCIYSSFFDKTGQCTEYLHNGSDQAVYQCMLYAHSPTHDDFHYMKSIFYDFNMHIRKHG